MNLQFPYKVALSFPGNLDYIPSIRKFVSELLLVSKFSPKFAYRSEIIIDEICNNAVRYGCSTEEALIELICNISKDEIEFTIKDPGGDKTHLERLLTELKSEDVASERKEHGMGLGIVKMLSESFNVVIDEQNLTSVHIVRKKEETDESK
jgi:anti-sigma regulatory factor (Ser/Thr protein kinase)